MKKLLLLTEAFLLCSLFFACKPNPKGGILENTYWTLASTTQNNKIIAVAKNSTYNLVFGENKLSGSAPCNSYFADFTTDGTSLSVSNLGSTERMCDEIESENLYLGLLARAEAYSVLKDRLEIYSDDARLTFSPMGEETVQKIRRREGIGRLEGLFPEIESDAAPLHLYPILRVDNPGNYPYQGSLIDTALYRYFEDETAEIWNTAGGEVMAVGRYGNFFITRIPGRYVSSDIALFKNTDDKFTRVETIAWAWCDEGWCNQQDAWLQDINKDNLIDIVQHYTLTDDKGRVREERITVLLQNEEGSFKEEKTLKPRKENYKMANLTS